MIVLCILAYIFMVSFSFAANHSRTQAIIQASILFAVTAVAVAELTSLFTAYNLVWVSLCWLILATILCVTHYCRLHTLMPCQGFFHISASFLLWEKIILIAMAATVAVAVFNVFISPPNMPVDSLTYHQPRAFMYYKNQSIHQFATTYGNMLYIGPLNAILMSEFQILCFGWDGAYKLVQFFAFLLTIAAVFQTTMLLCHSRSMAIVASALVCFLPMANLQAFTTQSDLVMTACCTAAVCLMMKAYSVLTQGGVVSVRNCVLIGFCCGLAVLCKLNAGVILIGFSIAFAVFLLIKLKTNAVLRLLAILIAALCVMGGFWARNAQDLNGDFLPLIYTEEKPNYSETGLKGIAFSVAKALSISLGSPTDKLAAMTGAPARFVTNISAALLGLNPQEASASIGYYYDFDGILGISPDVASCPVHACLVLVTLLFATAYAVYKKNWLVLSYTLSCLLGFILTITQCVWLESMNRYLMPLVVLSMPLCALMIQKLVKRGSAWKGIAAGVLCCAFAFNAICLVIFVKGTTQYYNACTESYDERMGYSHHSSVLDLYRQVTADIEENQYKSIGLDNGGTDNAACSFYIWMRPFGAAQYKIQFIKTSFRPDLEPADFAPDCIVAAHLSENITDTIDYHGHIYVKKFEAAQVYTAVPDTFFAYYVKND